MTTVNDLADGLIELLADAATEPDRPSPYMRQGDLMEALDINSKHTMSDVVTRACFRVGTAHPGYAILLSREYGYRLADEATQLELKSERRRIRCARTMVLRAAEVLCARSNGKLTQMIGNQIQAFVATIIDPAVDSLDEIISG